MKTYATFCRQCQCYFNRKEQSVESFCGDDCRNAWKRDHKNGNRDPREHAIQQAGQWLDEMSIAEQMFSDLEPGDIEAERKARCKESKAREACKQTLKDWRRLKMAEPGETLIDAFERYVAAAKAKMFDAKSEIIRAPHLKAVAVEPVEYARAEQIGDHGVVFTTRQVTSHGAIK